MSTLLLIGPQGSGKTTFLNSAKRQALQTNPTVKADDKFWLGVKIGGIFGAIIDTAGNTTTVLNNHSQLEKLLQDNNRTAFLFNGKSFLDEVKNPKSPGEITSIIKNLFLPVWNKVKNMDKKNEKQLFFIANYSTDSSKTEFYIDSSMDDARCQIIGAISEANESYKKMAQRLRYPFINYFTNESGFYCIDATDFKTVLDVGNRILK